jgi:transcription-repair coupling factor (superfamily II helicase)
VSHLAVEGVWGSARNLVVAGLLHVSRRPALVLVSGLSELHGTSRDLLFFAAHPGTHGGAGLGVAEFPPGPPAFWRGGPRREEDAERALCCHRLLRGELLALVTTPVGLSTPLLPPDEFRARTLILSRGDVVPRELLLERLEAVGYERVETVVEVGQWSLRGGIVDIFSPAEERPVRIEFFGDEVESLRAFDPTSQLSVETATSLEVLPLSLPAASAGVNVLAYLPKNTPVMLDDPTLLEAGVAPAREPASTEAGVAPAREPASTEAGVAPAREPASDDAPSPVPLGELLTGRQLVEFRLLPLSGGRPEGARPATPERTVARFTLEAHSVGSFRGQFRHLAAELRSWLAEGFRVRLVCQDLPQARRLRQILHEHGLEAWPGENLWGSEGLQVLTGECSTGFSVPAVGLTVLTETEIFGARRRTLRQPLYQRGAPLTAFTDLQTGDLVVHEEHGIGRYLGLKTLQVDARTGDFLLLEYAEGHRLYIPVERLGVISKYLGSDGEPIRLDRLGGASWQRVKESVRRALRQMAEELVQLYATRSILERRPFPADSPWQREFEAAFRFEETPDQLRAIEDVKADLERPGPMDRLVAGDVGYGKTEVALRAAFKAVMEGRQVAVLAPTTVLAQQHWTTFSERFAPFPVRVELLSRFRTPKAQKAVVADLRHGSVDVVIATHRLLSKDVDFKDLGLLIVDEEHRFGVAHKERLKQLRQTVDVLTLTATPIPRTLYMSLSGIRDMSTIETPPPERLPVETVVCRFDRTLIKETIEREISRGGQVFFVHNRVQSLPSMTAFLERLCPQARVVMGHGQMRERELEQVMLQFVTGQADVLVSTAIVESGLDIPAANTIVINRADRFGLAQLYQLRGRVGRGHVQAYAYLLVPADGRVDEVAQKRLRVIQELTQLGSGFTLALRDLEIRGAGNLLGAQQHGHIAAVGFDLYTKLLAEAVRELKGDPPEVSVDPVITVEVEAYLPDAYVPEINQRLALYKRLSGVTRPEEIPAVRTELQDRFGSLPLPAERLLEVVELRVLARAFGIEKVEAANGMALLTFSPSTSVLPERLLAVIREGRGQIRMRREFVLEAAVPERPWSAVHRALGALFEGLR